ncbi:MAG TPA: hypothetical protein PK794_07165, partial [Armatimonadota bacterium]|nr:hypothetical protein [Armatimonadota bacterium]
MLVYDRALSAAERLKIEEYLEGKYLGWPALMTIPVSDDPGPQQFVTTRILHMAKLDRPGKVVAQGITEKPLPTGRYRFHFLMQAMYKGEQPYSVRINDHVTPLKGNDYDFIVPPAAAAEPALARITWEGAAIPEQEATVMIDGLHIQRLSPLTVKDLSVDKILYSPRQDAAASATIQNYAAEPLKADIRFTEVTGLDDRRVLGVKPVVVPAGGEAAVSLPFNVGAIEYGRDLLVEIVRDGKVVEAKRDAYSVADNLWKVAIGSRQIAQTGATSAETYAREMLRVRAGYGNWVEKDFWAPDDWGLMVTPPGATWFSGQARRHENTERLQQQVQAAHAHGIKAITYGKCMAGGLPGWELARTKPQWFTVDAHGRTMGRPADVWDMEHWQEADKYKYSDYKYVWTYRWVDLRQMAPLDHGIDQLIASAKQFGWDGVRYDSGGFRAHYVPKDGKVLFDGVDSYNARNMRYTKERVWKELPGFLFGVNTNDPYSVGGVSPLKPTDACGHEFREMLAGGGLWMFEGMRDKPNFWGRRPYKTWSDYAADMVQAIRTIKGYGGHVCFSYGDTELYKFMIGTMIGAHDYMGEHLQAKGSENWGRFLTRWSSFLWDHRLRALPDDGAFTVRSDRPVWYTGFSNELVVSPTKRYVIIHLLNPPVNDECAKTKDEVPAPIEGMHLSLLAGKETLKRVLFIAPGAPNRAEALGWRNGEAGVAEISVPRLDIWGMVVAELEGNYAVPPAPPAFTEPLSEAELAEMEQCKPTGNVPVADNLLNPTPRFNSEQAKLRDFGAAKVTPPAGLTVGGEPGTDILLVKGFYHYTYRLPEALKALAPDARVTECTSRDLPKDYADLYQYDVVALINMGA